MVKLYLRLTGKLTANTVGKFENYTDEHMQFLKSGYTCSNCGKTLMKWWGVANVNCLSSKGENISIMKARSKGSSFQCPKCKYQWPIKLTKNSWTFHGSYCPLLIQLLICWQSPSMILSRGALFCATEQSSILSIGMILRAYSILSIPEGCATLRLLDNERDGDE